MTATSIPELNELGVLEGRPNLAKAAECIYKASPFQKKVMLRVIGGGDARFLDFAEDWIARMAAAVGTDDAHEILAKDYLDYTKMIRAEEMHFHKNKEYRYTDYEEVLARVYSQDDHMNSYVTGLGMTQIFWANHYGIVRFFLDEFIPQIKDKKVGAEIGVGHGFFHTEMLRGAPNLTSTILDVSPVSIGFTKKIIKATGLDPDRATPNQGDIQKRIPVEDGALDVLLMGEIVEHLEKGAEVMTAMASKLSEDGICFFTTAANAPAEDHILLFRTVKEIQDFLADCGWKIEKEFTATMGDMSIAEAEANDININYAAVIRPMH